MRRSFIAQSSRPTLSMSALFPRHAAGRSKMKSSKEWQAVEKYTEA